MKVSNAEGLNEMIYIKCCAEYATYDAQEMLVSLVFYFSLNKILIKK